MRPRWFADLFYVGACLALVAGCSGGGGATSTPAVVSSAPVVRVGAPSPTPKATPSVSPSATTAPGASPSPTGAASSPATHAPTSPATHAPTPLPSTTPTATPVPTVAPSPGPSLAAVAAKPADSIVDMIGVVTHFTYADTAYGFLTPGNPAPNGDSVLSSLKTLGVRHLRDGNGQMATNPSLCAAFQAAYAAGTDADIVVLPTPSPSDLPTIATCVGPGLRAIEGPNELDVSGDTNYARDDVTAMSVLWAGRGSAFSAGVALFAPSFASACSAYAAEALVNNDAIAQYFDYNNAHIYFSGYPPETNGFGSVTCPQAESTDIVEAKLPAPVKPIVVTETGYPDNCCGFNDGGFVSSAVKAKYTLRTVLEHYNAGARYAFFYELASEHQSYGLTDQYLNPKPAYTTLENFIRILQDPGGSGVAGGLRYKLGPSLAPVSQLLFEKQDGSFWLVLWQTNQSWDPVNNVPISVTPLSGTITFTVPPAFLRLYTFDPGSGVTTATALAPNNAVNTISVSDTPEILEVGATTVTPVLATPQPPVY